MTTLIELKDLTYSYPDGRTALLNVSLSISEGERVALVGPNGAGKSTLLLQLNGILRGKGKISIDGMEINDNNLAAIRKLVGVIFQDPNDQLFCPTVFDDVAFGPMHFGLDSNELRAAVEGSLLEVEMLEKAALPAHHLSIGERRRVTFAAVLACNPKVLALDEPAAMLDPKRRSWLIDFINRCNRTVILATHDLDFALRTCGRGVIMNRGQIVADGETKDILNNSTLLRENEME